MNSKCSIPVRILSLLLCLCFLVSALSYPVLAATDSSDVNYAVSVSFSPAAGQESALTGQTGTMILQAAIASTQIGTATVQIALPSGVDAHMPQFTESNGYTITVGSTNTAIQLLYQESGAPYLEFTLQEGQTINAPIQFLYPNGITANGTSVTVKDEDISVDTTIDGKILKNGGTLTFASQFNWNDVQKSETQTPLTINSSHLLNRNLTYDLNAISLNGNSGGIFTKILTLADTLTLPSGATFVPSGTATAVERAGGYLIQIGSTVVASISTPLLPSGITSRIEDVSINSEKNQLTFSYIQEANYASDAEYTMEMPNPALSVTIYKDQVYVSDLQALDGSQMIHNAVSFDAQPWITATPASSQATVDTSIQPPSKDISVKKSSSISTEDGSMILTYTIHVTNKSLVALSDVTIVDTLPEQVELVLDENPDYTVSQEDGLTVLRWVNQSLAINESVTKTVVVRVKDNVDPGIIIENTAKASAEPDKWVQDRVSDAAASPDANISIKKTSNKDDSGTVYEGDTIVYTIQIKNSGLDSVTVTPTDLLPEQIVDPRNYQYSLDGESWSDFNSNQITLSGSVITFPNYTLDNNPDTTQASTIWLRFTGTVNGTADMEGKQIVNTATASSRLGDKTSSSIVLVKKRTPKILLTKQAGSPVETDTDLYHIPYTLNIRNEGNETLDEDNVTVTDIMSGGLMPEDNAGTSGSITGTWSQGGSTSELTGSYQKNSDGSYTIIWTLPHMPGGTTTAPATATISYSGAISLPSGSDSTISSISASNQATVTWAGGSSGSSSSSTTLKPNLSMGKEIWIVNGERVADGTFSQIHVGDTITYRLTVKNSGSATAAAVITDDLPRPYANSGFAWILGENVTLDSNRFGAVTLIPGSNQLRWSSARIGAGETLYVYVTLHFPGADQTGGVAQFNQSFVNNTGTRDLTNTMTMTAKDPEDSSKLKTWISAVNHTTQPVVLSLSKSVTPEGAVIMGGDSATFTLSGFDVSEAVSDMQLIDNLADVATYMTLTEISTGQFIGLSSYRLILRYSDQSERTITITDPTQNQVLSDDLSGVVSVEWDFGTVSGMEIISAPALTMLAKEDTRGNAVNTATLYYNERQAQASAPVIITYSGTLKKTAMKDGKPVDNSENPLAAGDWISFTIEYKNMTDQPVTVNDDMPITDYMTVKGVEAGEITFNARVLDEKNNPLSNTVTPSSTTISEADINSDTAKKVFFTLSQPLNPGDMVIITYQVQLSDGFNNSQSDKNQHLDASWAVSSQGTAPNMSMLHNQVQAVQNGNTLQAETGYYYTSGENKVYFQKSVSGFGALVRASAYGGPDYIRTTADTSNTGSLSSWGAAKYSTSSYLTLDYVRYTILVSNDINAAEPLTVTGIQDTLPANVLINSSNTTHVAYSVYLATLYKNTTLLKGQALGRPGVGFGFNTDNTSTSVSVTADQVSLVTTIPDGYTAVSAKVSASSLTNKTSTTFALSNTSGGSLVLQPGEVFAFSYLTVVDRSGRDPAQWDNTAVLTTATDMPASENPGFLTQLNGKTVTRNMADGTRIAANTYSSTVSLYPPENSISITKAAAGRIEGLSSYTWSDVTAASATVVDVNNLSFNDVVCWDITVKNTGKSAITNAILTDSLPYPYQVIQSGSTMAVNTATSATVTGSVSTDYSATKPGQVWQTISIDGISLAANESRTYRIYTRYNASASKYSFNYTNSAQFIVGGSVLISQGSPVYDNTGRTLIGAQATASVYPSASAGSEAVKRVTEIGNESNQAAGTDAVNLIQVGADATLRYTCTIRNTSELSYQDFVLIDRLPTPGDTGVVNSGSARSSSFTVNLLSQPSFTLKLDDVVLTEGTDYTVDFTQSGGTASYTSQDWLGAGTTFSSSVAPEQARAFRLCLSNSVEFTQSSTLTLEFSAQIGSDAVPGVMAWNSFGYAFSPIQENASRFYAEPAKVGVQIPWSLHFTKVAAEDVTLPLSGGSFSLYQLNGAASEAEALLDPDNPGDSWTLTATAVSGADGTVAFENLNTGTYRLVETKAPAGRIKPQGQWNIVFGDQLLIQAVGNVNPPAFITTDTDALLLPNQRTLSFPSAGSFGALRYTTAGTFLAGLGLWLVLRHQRKRSPPLPACTYTSCDPPADPPLR